MDKILKILIVGPQASGKGTQAKMLSEKFNIPIFSTGNILRQKIVQGDELGKQLAGIMNKGELVSDEMVNQIIKEKIEKDGKNGYILDGYPRNLSQAEFLDGVDELIYVFEV
ncbi:adenylate kinase, partial [Candidatus Nomurabacteria bacterium CG10_big_fil_rev_8_21_14_0_10_35_16]